jgi:hypothetical protein
MTKEGLAILDYGRHYDLTLELARLGVLPFFWIACLVVYWWGRRYFSESVAVAAVLLFSFLPPVLAHAGLATTDMALTAFLGAAFLSGLIWVEHPTPAHAALFGASTGLAMLSKFSTLAFFPAGVGLALAWYFVTERPKLGWLLGEARKRLPSLGLAVLIACLLIWAGYRFSFAKVPAPELFQGIQDVMRHNAEGHQDAHRFPASGRRRRRVRGSEAAVVPARRTTARVLHRHCAGGLIHAHQYRRPPYPPRVCRILSFGGRRCHALIGIGARAEVDLDLARRAGGLAGRLFPFESPGLPGLLQ